MACQLVAGIHEYQVSDDASAMTTTGDAGTHTGQDGGSADAGDAGTPCDHHSIPTISTAGSGDPSAGRIYFALDSLDFSPQAADGGPDAQAGDGDSGDGLIAGFDLDGICTGYTIGPPSEPQGSSCTGTNVTDTAGGIDNSLQKLATKFSLYAPPELTLPEDTNISQGSQTILLELSGYGGGSDDPSVQVSIVTSEALEVTDNCATGTYHLYNSGTDGPSQPTPKFDGCDVWSVSSASVYPSIGSQITPPARTLSYAASIHNNQLVAYFTSVQLPIVGGVPVTANEVLVSGTIAQVESTTQARLYVLNQGTIAGRVAADDLLNTFRTIKIMGPSGSLGLCPGDQTVANIYDQLRSALCAAADLNDPAISSTVIDSIDDGGAPVMTIPTTDFSRPCNAISFGALISATQILTEGDVVDPDNEGVTGNCRNAPLDSCILGIPDASAPDGAGPSDSSVDAADAADAGDGSD